MGSLFGGGTTSTSSTTNTSPWAPQQPYMTYGLQQAQNIYQDRQGQGPYTGSFYSPINSMQTGGADQAYGYTSGAGAGLPATTANTAQTLQSGAAPFVQNAENLAQNGTGGPSGALMNTLNGYGTGQMTPQGVSAPLSGALESAAVNGANSISSGQQTLQQAATRALQDPTQQTIASAGAYANNPQLDASITAAEQPVLQTLNEQTLPGLNRQASMGGNLNSSRAGMAEAMANNNAASQLSNIEGTMRGNAYSNGLNLSAQQQEAGLNSAINAGTAGANTGTNAALGVGNLQQGAGEFATNTQLGAANSGLSSQLGYNSLNASTMLGANGQLGSGASQGAAAGTQAGVQAGQNLATSQGAGGVLQGDQNAQLANAYQQWQQQNGYQQGILNNYWGIAGTPLGSSSTTNGTTTQPTNVLGGLLGTGLAAGSIFGTGGLGAGLSAGLGSIPGVGYGLGALGGSLGAPAVGTSTMSPYWSGLMGAA